MPRADEEREAFLVGLASITDLSGSTTWSFSKWMRVSDALDSLDEKTDLSRLADMPDAQRERWVILLCERQFQLIENSRVRGERLHSMIRRGQYAGFATSLAVFMSAFFLMLCGHPVWGTVPLVFLVAALGILSFRCVVRYPHIPHGVDFPVEELMKWIRMR